MNNLWMFEIAMTILTCNNKYIKVNMFLNCTYGLYGQNYRVATLSTFYLTVTGIIIPGFKSIGHF